MVSGGDDGTIALRDALHEAPLGLRIEATNRTVEGLAVSSRDTIASAHFDGTIRTWSPLLLERDPSVCATATVRGRGCSSRQVRAGAPDRAWARFGT